MTRPDLFTLLDQLTCNPPAQPEEIAGWRVEPVSGGHNNLLFHARLGGADLAIKFTRRDPRDRAGREFLGLSLLAERAPGLTPKPVLLERERWPQPVVVQTWLPGEPCTRPPTVTEDWQRLAEYYAAVHASAREAGCSIPGLRPAVLTFPSAQSAADFVLAELQCVVGLPEQVNQNAGETGLARMIQPPSSLLALAHQLEEAHLPTWPEVKRVFGRCDPYINNFIRLDGASAGALASVDWENSGWVDPAFELGDLMTHPCYASTGEGEWAVFLDHAAALYPRDPTFRLRARVFRALVLVRWAGMFARYIFQRNSGSRQTPRLSPWPESWWQSLDGEYARYLKLAEQALNDYSG